jgi:hypothetical protein
LPPACGEHAPDLRRRHQRGRIGAELVALGKRPAGIDARTAVTNRACISEGASAMTTPTRRPTQSVIFF